MIKPTETKQKSSNFFQRNFLSLVVFLTGACILIIEIVATRILAPFFGNTIYTVSSVISTILLALSFGYYFGGRLSDTHPSRKWFFNIILISGFSVFFLQMLNLYLIPNLGNRLSIVDGPLIISFILFFLPSFLLAMLSPYAIKIQEANSSIQEIGKITGNIFFWSTFGSIFGSLMSGFYLIPNFGINQILNLVGLILIFLGILGLVVSKNSIKAIPVVFFFIVFSFIFLTNYKNSQQIIYQKDGIYEKIKIYDLYYNNHPTRFFIQDKSYSGAMYLNSDDLVFDYTKYYSIYKILNPNIHNALIIGGCAYSIPKALLKDSNNINVDVAEIEPSLFSLAKKYFRATDNPRLTNYTEDGRRLLTDSKKDYDFIYSDVYYSLYSIPPHFTTYEFFEIAKKRLNNNGIFIANLIGNLSRQQPSFIFSEINTFKSVFNNSYFFAVVNPNNINMQNIIIVGLKNNKKIDFNSSDIKNNPDRTISSLAQKQIDLNRFNLSRYKILTDNFAPVEYLTAKAINIDLNQKNNFDGNEAMAIIKQQTSYGARYPGSSGHKKMQGFLISEMKSLTNDEITQIINYSSVNIQKNELKNIIGKLFPEKTNRIILATHYDSKKYAVNDLYYPNNTMPGANDSASGVAVLLELGRYITNNPIKPKVGIDLVFFDGEEGDASLPENKWTPIGSTYFANNVNNLYSNKKPSQSIILDMVCDKNLNVYEETNSLKFAKNQTENFFKIANTQFPYSFYKFAKWTIEDDHIPLNKIGIPSFLVIDFDYPYFHTTQDTIDKCSAESLKKVGDSLISYIYSLK